MEQVSVRLLSGELFTVACDQIGTVGELKKELEAQRSSLRRCRLNLQVRWDGCGARQAAGRRRRRHSLGRPG